MPQNDQKFNTESKLKEAYPLTPRSDEYPRIMSHVKIQGTEGKISPQSDKPLREKYDVELGGEQNLRKQFIKPNFIEYPSAFK